MCRKYTAYIGELTSSTCVWTPKNSSDHMVEDSEVKSSKPNQIRIIENINYGAIKEECPPAVPVIYTEEKIGQVKYLISVAFLGRLVLPTFRSC